MTEKNCIQSFQLPSKTESLSRVELLMEEICEKCDINEDSYGNMLVALTEAVNNAISHGNQFDPNKVVNLEYESTKSEICFTIKDEGEGFDYEDVPDPTLPENIEKENGRGVFLMKSLADEVEFEEKGSIVKLSFYLSIS